ncbi:type IV pilus modification protein PilV [Marinobacter sp. F3R08]|uniref:type IV pilus modification protein PilV n=1 Tax=Marinobacter sp. F3R08 TaxID=2841559 RepID=UPI001C088E33|nr:type IV pilus modification protein PilV [Marinobacter sp. F3R08]MBU2952353.1 type IV pilus modification protein PilV [Marinobacter sp. F3R08]
MSVEAGMNHHKKVVGMRTKQNGVTMIEVMVAVLVLAVGLLGVAGMQTVSIQQTQGADKRSVAVLHLQSIADEIRSEKSVGDISDWTAALQKDLGANAELNIETSTVGIYRQATISVEWEGRASIWDGSDADDLSANTFDLIVRYMP